MLESFGRLIIDTDFLASLVNIVIINLILSGDNAVVIAMAVRSLPEEHRKKGIIFGSAAAVILRVVLTFFTARLLQVYYLKIIGGILIIWIAVRLFVDGNTDEDSETGSNTVMQAVRLITIADITMAADNTLAVGGASHGNFFLLLSGLGLSIPFVIFASNLLLLIMDKYPIVIFIGAAILGNVGGEMIVEDPVIADALNPDEMTKFSIQFLFVIGVIMTGLYMRWRLTRMKKAIIVGQDK